MRYRVVKDRYVGYEVQHKFWWWPFWMQTGFSNTHASLEKALAFIEGEQQPVVWDSRQAKNDKAFR